MKIANTAGPAAHTFGAQVVAALHLVHRLERVGLLPGKGLFVIVLAGTSNAVEEDATRCRVPEEVDDEEDERDEERGAKRRQEADDDAAQGRSRIRAFVARHPLERRGRRDLAARTGGEDWRDRPRPATGRVAGDDNVTGRARASGDSPERRRHR